MYKDCVYFIIIAMKKIVIGILFVGLVFLGWRVFSIQIWCTNTCQPWEIQSEPPACICTPGWWTNQWNGQWSSNTNNTWNTNTWWCDPSKVYNITPTLTWCCLGFVEDWQCVTELPDLGINMNTECLLNWQCSLNVYKVLWIRKSNQNPTVWWLFQDVVLAATSFVWTVVVIALIVSGLIFAFGSISWKDTKKAKTIMIDCFIWLLLVMWSYTIIRLIQFLATAWS